MTKLITALALFSIPLMAHCQELKFRYYNEENGMPSNTINCIYQDKEGLIWFGTDDGLVQYDTYDLKTWRHDPNNPASIGCNNIYCIHEDNDGILWIGTDRGIFIYDKKKDSFKTPNMNRHFSELFIKSIASDKQGRLWISTLGNGVIMYDKGNESIKNWNTKSKSDEKICSDYVPKIITDPLGNIWCIAAGCWLYKYENKTGEFAKILIQDKETGITEKNAYSMCLDYSGDLWIAGWDNGIFHFDKESESFTNYLTQNGKAVIEGRIHTLTESEPGIVILGSDHGITFFNSAKNQYHTISYSKDNVRGLSDDFVHDIVKDREGGLWIATYFGGVNYANPHSSNFIFRTCTPDASSGRIISRFCEMQDGRILIGTDDGGLFIYDPHKDITKPILIDKDNAKLNIHALLAEDSVLWVGTYSNGLYKMNLETGTTEHFPRVSDTDENPNNDSVYSLYRDRNGIMWIGTKTGVNILSPKGFSKVAQLGFNCDIIEIRGDSKGGIWFASVNNGLIKYEPKTQEIHIKSNSINIPKQLLSMCISRDRIWIGTAGKGLFIYDIERDLSETVPIIINGEEYTDLTIYQIINNEENIWLTSNIGLIRYNVTSRKANLYTKEDGLYTNIFNNNSGIISSKGRIFLGTNGGFNIFSPSQIFNRVIIPPPTHISQYKIDGNSLSVKFSALSYISPQKNRYRYILEDYDKEWQYLPYPKNNVSWTDLPAGRYTFKVQSCNDNEIWGDESVIPVRIEPRWWASGTSITAYILLIIAGVTGIIYKTKKCENKEIDESNNINHEKILQHSIINSEKDQIFLNALDKIIEQNLSNPNITIDEIAQMMFVSRSILFMRVKSVTGMTPNNYIKMIRLEKAAEYLRSHTYKINEICYMVGFNTPSYFTKCFYDQFGKLPKDFANTD